MPRSGRERYIDVTRRLTRVTAGGAAVIGVLSVVSVWGDSRAAAILVGSVIPRVICHPGEINQVVLSLVTNATHAIAETAAPGVTGRIEVRTSMEGRDVLITVSDNGPGISDAVRERFEPFFTTKGVGKGTGQGLAVGRAIVQRHGGTLTFESVTGRGTTFSMRLPIDGSAGGGAPE